MEVTGIEVEEAGGFIIFRSELFAWLMTYYASGQRLNSWVNRS